MINKNITIKRIFSLFMIILLFNMYISTSYLNAQENTKKNKYNVEEDKTAQLQSDKEKEPVEAPIPKQQSSSASGQVPEQVEKAADYLRKNNAKNSKGSHGTVEQDNKGITVRKPVEAPIPKQQDKTNEGGRVADIPNEYDIEPNNPNNPSSLTIKRNSVEAPIPKEETKQQRQPQPSVEFGDIDNLDKNHHEAFTENKEGEMKFEKNKDGGINTEIDDKGHVTVHQGDEKQKDSVKLNQGGQVDITKKSLIEGAIEPIEDSIPDISVKSGGPLEVNTNSNKDASEKSDVPNKVDIDEDKIKARSSEGSVEVNTEELDVQIGKDGEKKPVEAPIPDSADVDREENKIDVEGNAEVSNKDVNGEEKTTTEIKNGGEKDEEIKVNRENLHKDNEAGDYEVNTDNAQLNVR